MAPVPAFFPFDIPGDLFHLLPICHLFIQSSQQECTWVSCVMALCLRELQEHKMNRCTSEPFYTHTHTHTHTHTPHTHTHHTHTHTPTHTHTHTPTHTHTQQEIN
jgi:hypothetical protein